MNRLARVWNRTPEYAFAGLLLVFGLMYAVLMPPCQVADENDHYVHAYHISEGNIRLEMVDGTGGGRLPDSVLQLTQDFFYLTRQQEHQVLRESVVNAARARLELEPRHWVAFVSACYAPVPYLPQAGAMALGRSLGLGPFYLFYAGRLANLTLGVLAVFLAIRMIPFFKYVVGTIALVPVCVQQFASNSPDASTLAAAFLFSAVLLRIACVGTRDSNLSAALVALIGWLTLCKFPYGSLALAYVGVPPSRVGGRIRHALLAVGLMVMTGALATCILQYRNNVPDSFKPGEPRVSIRKQMRFVQSHPAAYIQVCATTIGLCSHQWLEQLGTLGWIDTPINPVAMQGFLLALVLVVLGDRTAGVTVPGRVRAAALAAVGVCTLLILTANYVAGDVVRAPWVHGISGRYFLPVLPLLLIPFYDGFLRLAGSSTIVPALAVGASAGIQVVSVACLVRRYYFPVEYELRFIPVAVVAGAFLVLAALAVATRQSPVPSQPCA